MQKTFFAIVTQYDCDPTKNPPGAPHEATGPIMMETYLDSHTDKDAVEKIASDRFKHYGWVRVATVTVDIPE